MSYPSLIEDASIENVIARLKEKRCTCISKGIISSPLVTASLTEIEPLSSILKRYDSKLLMYKREQVKEQIKSGNDRWQLLRHVTKAAAISWDLIRASSGVLESVEAWVTSFDKLMDSPMGRQVFTKFLESEYSDENMLFWNACEQLKKEKSRAKLRNMIKDIFEMFVASSAPLEINLDDLTKQELKRRMIDQPDHRSFEPAQQAVYLLMKRDCYARFIKSKVYRDFLEQVRSSVQNVSL